MDARSIIRRFGSRADVARICGVGPKAVGVWATKNNIPSRHARALLEYARERRIDVSAEDLLLLERTT